jgi:hypothetical protein
MARSTFGCGTLMDDECFFLRSSARSSSVDRVRRRRSFDVRSSGRRSMSLDSGTSQMEHPCVEARCQKSTDWRRRWATIAGDHRPGYATNAHRAGVAST